MSAPLSVVITGHVDHGKSTVAGRLLADAGGLPRGKLEQVRAHCARTARPFEYAFLLDALKAEQAQGVTIDVARVFFRTARRRYQLLDAPGHFEFLKNMVTGAARADAALLVIDAHEGIRENSRRHGYLLSFLGVRQVAVLVNKMDLVNLEQAVFERVAQEYGAFLAGLGVTPTCFIPVVARDGDNLAGPSPRMPWYGGPTVLAALDAFAASQAATDPALRMPVQDVYKFTARGDARRIVAGRVESGALAPGDELVFAPAGKRARVATVEAFGAAPAAVEPGDSTGFTLDEPIFVTRGQVATRAGDRPCRVARRLRAHVFWLAHQPLAPGRRYGFRLGTARTSVHLEEIRRVMDAASPDAPLVQPSVERHQVAECVFELGDAVAFDLPEENAAMSRFVLVADHDIAGGGIVQEGLADPERRAARDGRPVVVCVTSAQAAAALERRLAGEGCEVARVDGDDPEAVVAHLRELGLLEK